MRSLSARQNSRTGKWEKLLPGRCFHSLLVVMLALVGNAGAAAQEWRIFASTTDPFTIEFPGEPELGASTQAVIGAVTHYYTVTVGQGIYSVYVSYFPAGDTAAPEDVFEELAAALRESCLRVTSTDLPFEGGAAREFVGRCGGEPHFIRRVYIADDREYGVSVEGPPGLDAAPEARRFLDSFRIIGP